MYLAREKVETGPIRTMTIPRLELSAAALPVKLDKMLRKELNKELEDSVCWTDSMIVIYYIKDEDRRFDTFADNHPSVIHDGFKPAQWRHVGSALNPTHDLSRGLTAEELLTIQKWICGPSFLAEEENKLPVRQQLRSITYEDAEVRKSREARVYLIQTD